MEHTAAIGSGMATVASFRTSSKRIHDIDALNVYKQNGKTCIPPLWSTVMGRTVLGYISERVLHSPHAFFIGLEYGRSKLGHLPLITSQLPA